MEASVTVRFCCVVLYCVVRCCVVSCCSVLCCVVLCCVVSCRVVSCRVVWCRVVPCRVVSCRVVSCRVVSCRVVSCRVVSCRVVSCCVVLCCVVLCCVVSCRVVLCCVVLCCVVCSIWFDQQTPSVQRTAGVRWTRYPRSWAVNWGPRATHAPLLASKMAHWLRHPPSTQDSDANTPKSSSWRVRASQFDEIQAQYTRRLAIVQKMESMGRQDIRQVFAPAPSALPPGGRSWHPYKRAPPPSFDGCGWSSGRTGRKHSRDRWIDSRGVPNPEANHHMGGPHVQWPGVR